MTLIRFCSSIESYNLRKCDAMKRSPPSSTRYACSAFSYSSKLRLVCARATAFIASRFLPAYLRACLEVMSVLTSSPRFSMTLHSSMYCRAEVALRVSSCDV